MLFLNSLSSPDNSNESVHADAGGSFIQSENTRGHMCLCQWKTTWYHQVCVSALLKAKECILPWFHSSWVLPQHVLWFVWCQHYSSCWNPTNQLTLMHLFVVTLFPCWWEQVGDKGAGRGDHPRVQKLRRDIHRSKWLHFGAQQRNTQGDAHLCHHLQRGGLHWQRHPRYSV